MNGNGASGGRPKIYTLGQAAKLLHVAPRTCTKWFDAGLLKGYRLPCGGRDRRIPRAALLEFSCQKGIPLGDAAGQSLALVVGAPAGLAGALALALGESWRVREEETLLAAGVALAEAAPAALLVGPWVPRADAVAVSAWLAAREPRPLLAALAPEDRDPAEYLRAGYDRALRSPCDPHALAGALAGPREPAPPEARLPPKSGSSRGRSNRGQ